MEQALNKADILPIVSSYIKVNKFTATEHKAICPFHADKNASLFINTQKQIFNCMGCGKAGDVIDFICAIENVDFSTAIGIMETKSGGNIVNVSQYLPQKEIKKKIFSKQGVDSYHEALLNNKEALDIVKDYWGISEEALKWFKVGLKSEYGKEWVVIPYMEGNNTIGIKYRTLPTKYAKEFRREKDFPSILFNLNALQIPSDSIILTEGETKAMALHDKGFMNVVGHSTGANSWNSEWNPLFEKYGTVFIVFDSDNPGKTGALKIANKLGADRCIIIELPDDNGIKDLNDYFKFYTKEDFQDLLGATESKKSNVSAIRNTWEDLQESLFFKSDQEQSCLFPWANVNRMANPEQGELIVVSAFPGVGKTTMLLDIERHLVMKDIPVLNICLEMQPKVLLKKFIAGGEQFPHESIDINFLSNVRDKYKNLPLYFGYIKDNHMLKIEVIDAMIRSAVKKYGIKVVIFDHLDFLCRNQQYIVQQTAQCIQAFKMIAMQLNIICFVVHQPKKLEDMDTILTMNDLKNSASVAGDADRIIILHRAREGDRKFASSDYEGFGISPFTIFRFEKNRMGKEGQCILYYEGAKSYFRELTEEEESVFAIKREDKKKRKEKYSK